ncbi:PhzF family phenazine biosynthesis protein [Gammaproteobacteria bacterium]|nr:PhzF family phenazine biosynthesis protein [Gammaproteobacteria bacterium]MDA8925224.1 PhzF family phenazine biosynthesis protein [Gammaproteobacteria bacterium]MDA9049100.1 PhzF family phenazine biosynthesis protein [Gammaproteobacteria bacterium]MDA9974006.1 PhzF family phenazine biosynthesis protein [Gammaproteobacteria bacterium]MDC1475018.1 PhzF family phenazine biosynthesis protein [Gammaproteobacteria bacterium]
MELKMYQVDAFASKLFSGNPAAVVIVESPLSEELMQSIALENNLSETAFVSIHDTPISIRWFTPLIEVDLCGHATLASARILFEHFPELSGNEITFTSKSGKLTVSKNKDNLCLNCPIDQPNILEPDPLFTEILGKEPEKLLKGKDDYLAVFKTQTQIEEMQPHFQLLSEIHARGLVISAPGDDVDFVSRCFYPQAGIEEDPVTGSAHTMLTPYWAKQLKKDELSARQLSKRGGNLACRLADDRVLISGTSVIYFAGIISIV